MIETVFCVFETQDEGCDRIIEICKTSEIANRFIHDFDQYYFGSLYVFERYLLTGENDV